MILDIARFKTTTTFYGDVAFLESDYSSGDETHPFPSGDNVEIVTFEKSNNNTGIPIKIKSVREDYPLTGRSTPMLRGKNTPVLRGKKHSCAEGKKHSCAEVHGTDRLTPGPALFL